MREFVPWPSETEAMACAHGPNDLDVREFQRLVHRPETFDERPTGCRKLQMDIYALGTRSVSDHCSDCSYTMVCRMCLLWRVNELCRCPASVLAPQQQ